MEELCSQECFINSFPFDLDLLQFRIGVEKRILFIALFIHILYVYMELDKISCDSVNRIDIPLLLDRSIEFDEE